jgi:hypothetical protein
LKGQWTDWFDIFASDPPKGAIAWMKLDIIISEMEKFHLDYLCTNAALQEQSVDTEDPWDENFLISTDGAQLSPAREAEGTCDAQVPLGAG